MLFQNYVKNSGLKEKNIRSWLIEKAQQDVNTQRFTSGIGFKGTTGVSELSKRWRFDSSFVKGDGTEILPMFHSGENSLWCYARFKFHRTDMWGLYEFQVTDQYLSYHLYSK